MVLRPYVRVIVLILSVFGMVAACEAGAGSDQSSSGNSESGSTNSNSGGGSSVGGFDGSGGSGGGIGPSVAWVSGTVLAPEGTIGINEALVYATQQVPDPIPQQVFCDRCVNLDGQVPYTLSVADGSFTLGLPYAGSWNLVVQKGNFRRVRQITVNDGSSEMAPQPIDSAATTLPGRRDPAAGDEIPKMAVTRAAYDNIFDTLAKLGLGQTDGAGSLSPGTESFDLYDTPFFGNEPGTASDLLTDYSLLSQYHIVFFGCDNSWFNDMVFGNQQVKDNLRQFVEAGGKLYVTDWSYDMLRYVFEPESPLSWLGDTGTPDSAHQGIYNAPATVQDQGMRDWLAAQGITNFELEDNWTTLESTNMYTANNEDGVPTMFEPKVWVSGQVPGVGMKPSTMTYQFGCGRSLFSTYHTEAGFGATLAAQERALLYIILEVNVCIGDIRPPE